MESTTDRLIRRLTATSLRDLPLGELQLAHDRALRGSLPYVVAAWSTQDPATGLFTSCTVTGMDEDPSREAELFRHDFTPGEPASFRQLIAEGRTTAVLSRETGGDLARARRWSELLSHFGVTDELRGVFRSGGSVWGTVVLYRTEGTFSDEEAVAVDGAAAAIGAGLRRTLLRDAAASPQRLGDPPGVATVSQGGEVTAISQPARRWLEVGGRRLVTTARAVAAAVRSEADWEGASARLVLDDGLTLAVHGASAADGSADVTVVLERARAPQVGQMLIDAYGLTQRQREVLGLLLLGRSLAQVAAELEISEHTANDHRKAIYRRIGVSSRAELAALLQSEQYTPRTLRGVPPSPYGGYLE